MEVFLDNASTTRPYKEVIDVMSDVALNHWGNPSSSHAVGNNAKQLVEKVRDQIKLIINAKQEDHIIFTSGACEANSMAIFGSCLLNKHMDVITSRLEHTSIFKACDNVHSVLNKGIYFVDCNEDGFVERNALISTLIRHSTVSNRYSIVSITSANSEIGTIQNIKELSNIAHQYRCIFHTDATQLFAERVLNVQELGVDMMSVSAQKFHGPRGIGFLYVRNGIDLNPLISGAQEYGLRGGTENTPAICGMGKALEMLNPDIRKIYDSKYELLSIIRATYKYDMWLNGSSNIDKGLANNLCMTFSGVNADSLVTMCSMNGVYISKGSACNSYHPEPSKALKAIGLSDTDALSTIRITVSGEETKEQLEYAAKVIVEMAERLRKE